MLHLVKKLYSLEFKRFVLVGVLNTLFGYGLFSFFIYLGIVYPVAVLIATVLGVLFNFRTIGTLVFGVKGNNKLMHFVFVYVVIYILNVAGLWCAEIYGLENKYIAGAVLLAPLAVISFVLNKSFVFNR